MRCILRSTLTCCTVALLAAVTTTSSLVAQSQTQVLAFYPLLTDLADATSQQADISLLGNGVPAPLPPSGNGVCHNGTYYYGVGGGQDIRTPLIASLDTSDFQVNVEFNIAALPPSFQDPILMGGHSYRWLGIYLQANGIVGIKHNNSNYAWSTTTLSTGRWYSAGLRNDQGNVELYINGTMVLQVAVGVLNDGNNKNFTTNDFSNGGAFNGCIRNMLIVNDPTAVATSASYGSGCAGSAGVVSLTANNSPQLGISLRLDADNLDPAAVLAFMSIGFSNTTSLLGALPFNLSPFGLGANCNLLTSADVSSLFSVSGGSGTFEFPVPMNPSLGGLVLYYQCASIDGGAPGGLAVSNGVDTAIGF